MASKDFGQNLRDIRQKKPQQITMSADTKPKAEPKPEPEAQPSKAEKAPIKETKKRTPGRPRVKTEPCKTINISVPVSILEQVELAKSKYHGNLTEYVNAVIAEDLRQHMTEYKEISNLLNNKQ